MAMHPDYLKDKPLQANYKGRMYLARVMGSGQIKLKLDGKLYKTPSGAGVAVRDGKSANGWVFWKYKNDKGEWVKINTLL